MHRQSARERNLLRSLAIGGALLIGSLGSLQPAGAEVLRPNVDTGGSGGGGVAVVVPEFAQTPNGRSIALIESTLAPGGELAGWDDIDVGQTANERSIALEESKLAPGGVLAGGVPDFALTQNGRSIAMIESTLAPGGVLADGTDEGEVAYGPVAFVSPDVNQCWECGDFA